MIWHHFHLVDILPTARSRGTPTFTSGYFLFPWRLACTVPLVVVLTFASPDVTSRKPCGRCETILQAPTYYVCILTQAGKSGNPTHPCPKQGLACIPVAGSQGLSARFDKLLHPFLNGCKKNGFQPAIFGRYQHIPSIFGADDHFFLLE